MRKQVMKNIKKATRLKEKLEVFEPVVKNNFQKAFMDAAIKRATVDDLFSLDPDIFMKNLEEDEPEKRKIKMGKHTIFKNLNANKETCVSFSAGIFTNKNELNEAIDSYLKTYYDRVEILLSDGHKEVYKKDANGKILKSYK